MGRIATLNEEDPFVVALEIQDLVRKVREAAEHELLNHPLSMEAYQANFQTRRVLREIEQEIKQIFARRGLST